MIDNKNNDVWYDAFYGEGVYFKNFPLCRRKYWSEIVKEKDFFKFDKKIDIICTNPPYSIIDKVLEKSIKLQPRIISYLIGCNNLTARRIEIMNKEGYGLTKLHMCKVFKWYGMSYIVVFEKNKENVITFDRTVWR